MKTAVLLPWLLLLALASAAAAQEPGDRVLALWPADGMWYPARIEARNGDEFQLAYDDGDVGSLRGDQFVPLHWEAGSALQCNWRNAGRYYPGVIERIDGERIDFLYEDGDRETMTISRCRSLPPLER
jgi:hypothetical protein